MTVFLKHINIIQHKIKIPVITFGLFMLTLSIQVHATKDTSIIYIHQVKPSFKARLIKATAKLILPKNSISRKLGKDHFVSKPATIPKKLFAEFVIDTTQVNGRNVFTISPKKKKKQANTFYFFTAGHISTIYFGSTGALPQRLSVKQTAPLFCLIIRWHLPPAIRRLLQQLQSFIKTCYLIQIQKTSSLWAIRQAAGLLLLL